MTHTFAQIEAVPASNLKWILLTLGGLVFLVAAIIGAWASLKQGRVSIEPNPMVVEKFPKRFNYELCQSRHDLVREHLTRHDEQINQLWVTLRKEAEHASDRSKTIYEKIDSLRKEFNDGQNKTERTLGRIEGAIRNGNST